MREHSCIAAWACVADQLLWALTSRHACVDAQVVGGCTVSAWGRQACAQPGSWRMQSGGDYSGGSANQTRKQRALGTAAVCKSQMHAWAAATSARAWVSGVLHRMPLWRVQVCWCTQGEQMQKHFVSQRMD